MHYALRRLWLCLVLLSHTHFYYVLKFKLEAYLLEGTLKKKREIVFTLSKYKSNEYLRKMPQQDSKSQTK